MNRAAHEIDDRIRRVIAWQIVSSLLAAAFFFSGKGWGAAEAVLYGGITGVAVTLLLGRSIKRASRAADNPGAGMRILYVGAAQRFFFVLGALALGLATLHLEPLALLVGFGLAQGGYFINARGMTRGE
ncbi:MAG TPA: ATP synthase subunit I [Burkholderiales bacterium]|nr:ATP synthase subunit I [Burkholderiales bacterium]